MHRQDVGKLAVLTFDDGFKNVLRNAYPAMKEQEAKGCLYVVSSLVGSRELLLWRWLIMASFYSISFLLRPMRVARLIASVLRDRESDTVLEQRLAARLRRPSGRTSPAAAAPR